MELNEQIAAEKAERDAKMELGLSMLKELADASPDRELALVSLAIADTLKKIVAERDRLNMQLLRIGQATLGIIENPNSPQALQEMLATCEDIVRA